MLVSDDLVVLHRTVQRQLLQHYWLGQRVLLQRQLLQRYWSGHYYDIEWFALEMNRVHSVIIEIASKYCISDSFVDYDGCSICSKGFLPTAVDIMVI